MNRLGSVSGLLLRAALNSSRQLAPVGAAALTASETALASRSLLQALGFQAARTLHSSPAGCQESAPVAASSGSLSKEPARKYRSLVDKELWHEAWMYEDKFGTEEDPIVVPSLEPERIIGVTDPEDDSLVVWGILKAGEGPRQFIENGEFYVLQLVEYVKKVGDVREEIEAGGKAKLEK